jgi:hypothetical protein
MVGPSSGIIDWYLASSQVMRLNSTGLGIGTSSPSGKLHVSGGSNPQIVFDDAASRTYGIGVTVSAMSFYDVTGAAERMRIDSAGNVGIGETSPTVALVVKGTQATDGNITYSQQIKSTQAYNASPFAGLTFSNIYTSGGASANLSGIGGGKENATDGNYSSYLAFYTRVSGFDILERMRIDSSGNLLVNTTSQFSSAKVTVSTTATTGIASTQSTTGGYCFLTNALVNSGTYYHINFQENGTQRGSITSNGTVTVYATTSDYRLKENVKPMVNALATVTQLKPVTYDWTESKINGQGFIAHELQAVIPDAVVGLKDDIDSEGNPIYQQIDTSVLVATLTAAIQELKAEFDAYKSTHP